MIHNLGINALGWHTFKADGLTAYEYVWILKWLEQVSGWGNHERRKDAAPQSDLAWRTEYKRERVGYRWVPCYYSDARGHLEPVTFYVGSAAFADAFQKAFCEKELHESLRDCRKFIADAEAKERDALRKQQAEIRSGVIGGAQQ